MPHKAKLRHFPITPAESEGAVKEIAEPPPAK